MRINSGGLLLLGLLSAPAYAADWTPLADAGSVDQYFYDRSKLVIKDEEITYWKKIVFNAPQNASGHGASSRLMQERMNCGEHTVTLLAHLYYSASGEAMELVKEDETEPAPIIPDSPDDAFERALCPQVWQHQEEARIKAEQKATSAELAAEAKGMTTTEGMPEASNRPPQPSKPADPATDPRAAEQLY